MTPQEPSTIAQTAIVRENVLVPMVLVKTPVTSVCRVTTTIRTSVSVSDIHFVVPFGMLLMKCPSFLGLCSVRL